MTTSAKRFFTQGEILTGLPLQIFAGKRAFAHIREHGLYPKDIRSVYGASGAAKWLAITGLDAAIFSTWLASTKHTISLFGTSIGAMKLAAAVQDEPKIALESLARAYIGQTYAGKPTPAEIAAQSGAILDVALANGGAEKLINHPRFRYHCGAVHCQSLLRSDEQFAQVLGMLAMSGLCLKNRNRLVNALNRVIFYSGETDDHSDIATDFVADVVTNAVNNVVTNVSADPSIDLSTDKGTGTNLLQGADCFETLLVKLSSSNIKDAILSSGSIPVYMDRVQMSLDVKRPGARTTQRETLCLRDGGLLDYHPLPDNIERRSGQGFVLYPHFYSTLKETWFDKFYAWRKVDNNRLDDVILIAPSPSHLARLALQRIPDRADFKRFSGQDALRIEQWTDAVQQSERLGDCWLELCERQDWSQLIPL